MKIFQDISHDADYIGNIQENRVGIDRENIDFITTLLTSNLYSKPVASFLRETIANAYDSHIEANTKEYILLVITRTAFDKYNISIRDYGTGLSPERFNLIYRNIGSSTKRDSNDYIGAFGIGRFAGLSCADVVNINSYYEGVKYSYLMYKNGKGINIDKLSETNSSPEARFKNGLEIAVTLNCSEYELIKAINKLVLFDKLHIEFINKSDYGSYSLKSTVEEFNNRTITDFKTFSVCNTMRQYRYLKVGKIIYDNSDWGDLYTNSGIIIDIPIGEVDITPNREELQFTEKTKKAIQKRISETKKELQEAVDSIKNEDFTMVSFYKFATESDIEYKYKDATISIDRDDISLGDTSYTINKKPVPKGFADFLNKIKFVAIPKDNIYKIFNSNKFYRYGRFTKSDVDVRCLLNDSVYVGIKKDKITRAITVDWFSSVISNDKPTVVISDLSAVRSNILQYGRSAGIDYSDINNYLDFIHNNITFYNLANDSVPDSFKAAYKTANKKNKSKGDQDISVRLYNVTGYTMTYLKYIDKKGIIIYGTHTKEDFTIRKLVSSLAYLGNITFITVKKEYLSTFESDRRFILYDDFIDLRNNILAKVATTRIILRNLDKDLSGLTIFNVEYQFKDMPIIQEFRNKYSKYIKVIRNSNETLDAILDKYEKYGWYNKADVEYFKISPLELQALNIINNMEKSKTEIIKSIAFFMFGRNEKIGLKTPKVNICKYLKKFKYGCI